VSLEAEVAVGLSAVVPRAFATRSGTAKQHTLRSALEAALRLETARVMGSDALVENALWDDDVAVSAVPRRSAADFLDENRDGAESNAPTGDVFALRAELLVAPTSVSTRLHPNDDTLARTSSEEDGGTNVVRLTFEGVVSARSYAFARANVGDAVSDLRRDVARSLRSRLDTFLDEADDALEEEEAHGVTSHNALASIERALSTRDASGKEQTSGALLADAMRLETNDASRETVLTFAMPRRAWARWLGGLSVCDYLAQGETEADVVARCAEVMRFEVPGGVKGVALAEREAVSRRSGAGAAAAAAAAADAKRETRNAKPTPETSPASSGTKSKSSSSYAAYALGAGVALVSAGLANLAMSSPDIAACVGELCERAAETARGAL
jgi:hypothetical protein